MPEGCGTWTVYWMIGPSWPDDSEIDILEGVNTQTTNGMTIQTTKECIMQGTRQLMTGTTFKSNGFNVYRAGQGCGVKDEHTTSYGAGLNENGGRVCAMRWEQATGIQI